MYKRKIINKKLKGWTLQDTLITLAIIGILIALVLPNLIGFISKAKSTEAQLHLEHLYTLEKTYFYVHSKYSNVLTEVGFEQAKLTSEGGNANYRIEVTEAGVNKFSARATAIADFDGDGVFNVWEIDQDKNIKEVTPD